MKQPSLIHKALILGTFLSFAPESWAADDGKPPKAERTSSNESEETSSSAGARARARARETERRAKEAGKSGDELVAERLLKVATIWEKIARHQEKAAKLEAEAAKIERETLELKSKAKRAHSLVEQTETRRARALSRLRELGLDEAPAKKNSSQGGAPASTEQRPPQADSKADSK